jgi:hypothetical protein
MYSHFPGPKLLSRSAVCESNCQWDTKRQRVGFSQYLLQFALLSAGNEDFGSILDEGLSGHLSKAGRAASYESNMVLEVEQRRHFKI